MVHSITLLSPYYEPLLWFMILYHVQIQERLLLCGKHIMTDDLYSSFAALKIEYMKVLQAFKQNHGQIWGRYSEHYLDHYNKITKMYSDNHAP